MGNREVLMAATKTSICNQALVLVGSATISDFATDTSKAGQMARLFYDDTVDELLELFPWSFAMKRINLTTPKQDEPKFGFTNSFQLPADYLDIHETDLLDGEWRIEENTICVNEDNVSLLYLARVTDTSKFTPLFRQTLIYLLAAKFAIPLSRNKDMAVLYHQKVQQMLPMSTNADSHPNHQRFESDSLIAVRR